MKATLAAARSRPEAHRAAPLLLLRGITKQWRGRPNPVLNDVSLSVHRSSVVRLSGSNGAGKTTLLRIAAGVVRPDGGTVHVHGLNPKRDRCAYQRRIGYLSASSAGLYPRLTVRSHLDLWTSLLFVPPSMAALHIESVAKRFMLGELLDQRTDRISMGQRQRLRLALTFLHRPSLLLLDEPENSLDQPGRQMLAAAVEDVRRRQGAVVWCSPSGDDAETEFDLQLVIENGKVHHA